MEKNKIVTSLTLAGILTAGVLGGNSNAATKSLGVCKNIITGKDLVPYVLDNANDIITSDRIRAEYTTASNLQLKYSNKVSTGDTFTTASGKKTVIVYGDVNQDGIVDTYDAKLAQKIYLEGDKSTATDVQKAAADVQRNNNSINVDTYDANNIQKFWLQGGEYVKVKPVGVPDDVTTETEYNVTVDAGKGINNQNYTKLKTTLTPTTAFIDETGALKIQAKKLNEETGKYGTPVELTATFASVKANMNSVDVDIDLSKTGLIDITSDTTSDNTNGTYKIEVLRGTTVVAETDVTTHVFPDTTTKLQAAVYARRVGSENAEINVVGYGEGTIEKVYCSITAPSPDNAATLKKDGTGVTVTNNEAKTTFTNNELTESTSYTVYYVLEDSYGNLLHKSTVAVAEDADTNAPIATVKKIEAVNNANKFNVTIERAAGVAETTTVPVTVVLYKDGKAIATEKVTVPASANSVETSVFADMNDKTGTYTVKAIVDGSTTNQPSDIYDSKNNENGTTTVSSLAKATNIKVSEVEDQYTGTKTEIVSWDYAGKEEVTYTLQYKEHTVDNWDTPTEIEDLTEKKIELDDLSLDDNKIYDLRVVTSLKEADNKKIPSTSDEKQVFVLNLASAGTIEKTSNSIKLTEVTPLTLTGKGTNAKENLVTTYRVKVWYSEDSDNHTESNCIITKDIVLNKEANKATYESEVIEGLEPKTSYYVEVYAVYDGVMSNAVARTVKTNFKEIPINFTVDKTITTPTDGKIKIVDSTHAFIGKEDVTNTQVFSSEYQAILNNVVSKLATGDKVKVSGNNVEIELAEVTDSVAFGDLKGLNVSIKGNINYRTISNTNTEGKDETKANSIVLKDGLFTVSTALEANTVTVNNAKIKSTVGKYVVSSNTTSNINNVDVKATVANAEIAPTAGTLTVTPSNSSLEITDNTTGNLAVNFTGDATNTAVQSGNVSVASKEGDVTITANNANITGNITANVKAGDLVIDANTNYSITGKVTVTIEDGEVDLSDPTLSGAKAVTVVNVNDPKADPAIAESTVVTGILKNKAPFTTTAAIDIRKYTDDDTTVTGVDTTEVDAIINAEEKAAAKEELYANVKTFINNLGISDKADATIEIEEDVNGVQTVTVTFDGNVNYTFNGSLELK